ncbi:MULTISPECIES: LysR family transcriptional regulator [Pseudomonas]|uniref:HTH-type transcriptional regulator PgrR n=1 Tax=Pseudomonas fluorescens TaxID=294 RepID=A0A5E7VLW1_PSEFL|nr:LysR family transcriptional regulator [Pseudomonas fluorescens]VVQ23738.1 HTH-type transcriptional regulator PgrR [Pseudomonas fluorescens]
MKREEMADLTAFLAVAEARSFTKAATKLGLSQSALSQIVQRLEQRLGMRLLNRTTRSVAPTEAGELLLQTLAPALDELDASIAALSELGGKPAGTIRITSVEHAAKTILWPVLRELMITYPDIKTDLTLDYGLTDIVAERFDAGVRLGEDVDKDMIALRISPDIPMTIVGASTYFDKHPIPVQPQELVKHQCINLRLSTSRGHYVWPFRKDNRELKVRVNGPAAFNSITMILDAVLDGFGLAFLPLDQVQEDLDSGRLVRVLEDWTPCFPGYHLYYPSRRQLTPAFALLVKAFRNRLSR